MKNQRAYGIKFQKGNDCGIAYITVLNNTTGKYIGADGSESDTLVYRTVDMYQPASGYTTAEKIFAYWVHLTPDHDYTITVANSGTYNPAASSPYNINILEYLSMEQMIDAKAQQEIRLYHSDNPNDYYSKIYNEEENIENLIVSKQFVGDGAETFFTLSPNEHAYEFVKCTPDNEATWLYPSDYLITWGSNTPDYNNESIDENGFFGINFIETPEIGAIIKIQYIPKINRYKIQTTLKQPTNKAGDFVDYKTNIRLMDFGIELLK